MALDLLGMPSFSCSAASVASGMLSLMSSPSLMANSYSSSVRTPTRCEASSHPLGSQDLAPMTSRGDRSPPQQHLESRTGVELLLCFERSRRTSPFAAKGWPLATPAAPSLSHERRGAAPRRTRQRRVDRIRRAIAPARHELAMPRATEHRREAPVARNARRLVLVADANSRLANHRTEASDRVIRFGRTGGHHRRPAFPAGRGVSLQSL